MNIADLLNEAHGGQSLERHVAKELVRAVVELAVRLLVTRLDGASVELRETSDKMCAIDITCDPHDAGLLIGRGGRIIQGIQALAAALGGKHGLATQVQLLA